MYVMLSLTLYIEIIQCRKKVEIEWAVAKNHPLKNAKKIIVIGLMAILVLSVTLSAITFYSRRPTALTSSDLNSQVNAMVASCLQTLPNGTQQCDSQLRDAVIQLCQQDNSLDACKDGKTQQYYSERKLAPSSS
jgi:hypothetical protein